MSAQEIILFAVKASIVLTVFGVALSAHLRDGLYLFQRPKELLRSFIAMNVAMPLVAIALCLLFNLDPAVKIALVALSVSPVPPFLPKKQLKCGGSESYVVGLLVAISLLSIITVPATIALLGSIFSIEMNMPVAETLQIVAGSVLVPLFVGMAVRTTLPKVADKIAGPVLLIAAALLVGGLLPIIFKAWPALVAIIGNGTMVALIGFSAIGIALGHILGGPSEDDRTALALANSSRHPAVALAIARINFPEQHAVMAVVLMALILGTVAASLYLSWRKKHGYGMRHAKGKTA